MSRSLPGGESKRSSAGRAPDSAQTLNRGLDVLELLASSRQGRTITQIAADLGLSRTIVYRLATTLVDRGLLHRDSDGLHTVGLGTLRLGENVLPALRESTRPALEKLAERAAATAHFCVADGPDVLAVSVVEPSSTTFHVAYRVGSRTPAGLGALGRAVAAAAEGRSETFESVGALVPGAHGIVTSLPGLKAVAAAIGVVTLAGAETEVMRQAVEDCARELEDILGTSGSGAQSDPPASE
ncbi:DNA-binding transcriptional regulator, IclR family [Paracoccus isoporae]|uniref:DNA-binding transcriptional regulator, IclR family n=1 Tax=Paracoccus isoporae TaxID=591205 RepID=A0A1G6ZN19_9RHOB|nr:helix-turn-helix domain-containing protein [Paracoccus isoporae]SDE03607.1 DNA-binding transcriptional regulator, IclR family [Paracoccus isoporae]